MDQKDQLHDVLTQIGKGEISEASITFIKNYSNIKSEWLSSASSDQLLKVCESLKDFIASCSAKTLNLEVMILVLESYAHKKTGNPTLLLKHCLPAICKYIETALERSRGKIKEREKSALQKILSSLTNLELPFMLFPRSLLKTILLFVINDVSDFDEYCLLFLLSLPKKDRVSSFVIETMFEIIEESTKRFKKTFKLDDAKLPMQFLFLIAYTQGLLGEDDKNAYEKSFTFTAHFVDCLYNKCCDNRHFKTFMTFAEDYVTFLISLGNDPDWPVVPFILQLITKNISCKLIHPDTNVKFQSFCIKQIPRIAERLKGCEAKKAETKDLKPRDLMTSVIAYIATLPRNYVKGDIGQAYKNLWSKHLPDMYVDEFEYASREDAARAATILEQMQGHATSIDCLKLLLKCSNCPNKMVKTNAVKALGKVILLEPSYLSIANVQSVLGDCLESLTASGRVSIGNMFATFLCGEPALTANFIHYFMVLLNDDAFTVRCAAINAVGKICAVDYFHDMEVLSAKILLLFHDPEIPVQSAVLNFFSDVFVKRVNHLGCLVEINVNANIRNIMVPILKKLGEDLQSQLSLLAEAVVLYLKTNSTGKKKLAAGVVLESLAQVYPACLVSQLPNILKLSFCDEKEPYLMKKLCSVLMSTSPLIRDEDKAFIYKSVKKLLLKKFDWMKLSPCVLKLLMVLDKFATENIFDQFIQPSLAILKQNRSEDSARCDILLPLSIVAFLWKDYENNEEAVNLLMDFLRKPCYQMTVLSALTEARLERSPKKANPVLNGLINDFIRNMENPRLVIAGLQYLNSCLIGDEAKYEEPEMKQLGDSTTASLSQLMQETLQAVLACTLNRCLDIRRSACGVIRQIVQSGLLLRSHFISYLVAMTADDCSEIRNAALDSLKGIPEAEVAIFAIEGVRLGYALLKVLHPDSIVRGTVNGNSIYHKTFELIRAPSKVRKLLESLVTESTKRDRVEEVVFLLDNVVFYPFKDTNAVGHVLDVLEKSIFEFRKMFHSRLMGMAKNCLDKAFKISPWKCSKDKLPRVAIEEYLGPFICNALKEKQNAEESAMALLVCLEDTDFEPEKTLGEVDEEEIVSKKQRESKGCGVVSGGKKRQARRASVKAQKRLCFAVDTATEN